MYTEDYQTLLKEIKEDTNNGKSSCIHELEDLILLKCPCYLKPSIDSMHSPQKSNGSFFGSDRKKNSKIYLESQRIPSSQTILMKKYKVGRLTLHDIKIYYKTLVINIILYGIKTDSRTMKQNIDTRNRSRHIQLNDF